MPIFGNAKKPVFMTSDLPAEKRILAWPDSYYQERDPKKRQAMLELALEEGLSPEEDRIRKELFKIRYPEFEKSNGQYIKDIYLAAWLTFRSIGNGLDGILSIRKLNVKEIRAELKRMGFEAMSAYGKKGEDLLFLELRHLATLYFYLCREDRQYGSIILGIGTMGDESIAARAGAEAFEVGFYVPKKMGMEEECRLWTRAVSAGYAEVFPDSGFLEQKLESGKEAAAGCGK
jgi:hypothetical protein